MFLCNFFVIWIICTRHIVSILILSPQLQAKYFSLLRETSFTQISRLREFCPFFYHAIPTGRGFSQPAPILLAMAMNGFDLHYWRKHPSPCSVPITLYNLGNKRIEKRERARGVIFPGLAPKFNPLRCTTYYIGLMQNQSPPVCKR